MSLEPTTDGYRVRDDWRSCDSPVGCTQHARYTLIRVSTAEHEGGDHVVEQVVGHYCRRHAKAALHRLEADAVWAAAR